MDTRLLFSLLIALLIFIYLESILFFKVIKYLVEKIVLIKTFAAGLPIQADQNLETESHVPNFPDEDFGEGDFITGHEPEDEFSEELPPGDELESAGI